MTEDQYGRFSGYIERAVRRMTVDCPWHYEDALQESLLSLCRYQYDGYHSFITFCKKRIIGAVRKVKRESQSFHPTAHHLRTGGRFPQRHGMVSGYEPQTYHDFDITIDLDDDLRMAGVMLSRLDPRHSRAIKMRYIDGMTSKQIGNEMGYSDSNVREWIRHGIKRLRSQPR